MDCPLDLSAVGGIAVSAFNICGTDDLVYASVLVVNNILILYNVCAHKPYFSVGLQAEIFRRGTGGKIVPVNINVFAE